MNSHMQILIVIGHILKLVKKNIIVINMAGFMDISGTNLVIKSSNTTENILCMNTNTIILTKCQANNGISVSNSIAYASGMIGYTHIINGNAAVTISASSNTVYSMTGSTTTIPRGVYIIHIKVGVKVSNANNNVHFISSGLSTTNNSYSSGGTGICAMLTESVLTTAANQNVYGSDCRPVDLSGNPYHLVINANSTVATNTLTSYCQCLCTRIA